MEPTKGEGRKWSIKVKDLQKNTVTNESFDAVMVCNGHYFEPAVPNLKGRNTFQGQQLHSHDYRTPEVFVDKTVVVLGAGPSGTLLHTGKKRMEEKSVLPENVFFFFNKHLENDSNLFLLL